jgi:hypothetical protein
VKISRLARFILKLPISKADSQKTIRVENLRFSGFIEPVSLKKND